jgi:hypothetical protein
LSKPEARFLCWYQPDVQGQEAGSHPVFSGMRSDRFGGQGQFSDIGMENLLNPIYNCREAEKGSLLHIILH